MKPVKTDYANTNFTKEGCFDLPGTRYTYEDGSPGVETVWELEPEDIKRLSEMERPCVRVYMLGNTVPPMFLATEQMIEVKAEEDTDNENSKDT